MPLQAMIEAARRAGALLLERQADLETIAVEEKGLHDFVTDIDRASEDLIVRCLESLCPGIPFLAEESDERRTGSGERWIIDPLDGTTNYLHRYPCFSVSIGLQAADGSLAAGVVLDPVRDELFAAERGRGATLGDQRLAVSRVTSLSRSLLVTGFPFKILERLDEYLAGFRLLLQRSSGLRRDGSAALDLCFVAAGRVDGFWEFGLAPWDVAAGGLIAREAGAVITDAGGGDRWLEDESIVCAAPGIHADILTALAEAAGN